MLNIDLTTFPSQGFGWIALKGNLVVDVYRIGIQQHLSADYFRYLMVQLVDYGVTSVHVIINQKIAFVLFRSTEDDNLIYMMPTINYGHDYTPRVYNIETKSWK